MQVFVEHIPFNSFLISKCSPEQSSPYTIDPFPNLFPSENFDSTEKSIKQLQGYHQRQKAHVLE